MTMDAGNAAPTRKVGLLLGIGIFLLPIIFAWFTLRRGRSTVARVVSFIWLVVTLIAYAGAGAAPDPTSGQANGATTEAERAEGETKSAAGTAATKSKWRYNESRDEMRSDTSKFATVRSENELDFEFPYNGGAAAEITVRRNSTDGLDAFIKVDKGQFMCDNFSATSISAKFDDGPIQKFSCTGSSSGESEYAFISNAQRFLTALKGSKRVVVEAEFFQYGRGQYTFETDGLEFE